MGARSSRGDEGGSRGDEGDNIFWKERAASALETDSGRGRGIDGDVEAEPCTISCDVYTTVLYSSIDIRRYIIQSCRLMILNVT
jgi:hypothetical protein